MVQKTWQDEMTGRGADAKGLSHKSIKVLKVWQNENRQLYETYINYYKKTCKGVGKGNQRVQKIEGLQNEAEVMTSALKIPTLESLRTAEINELFLFHGTPNELKDTIAKQGLDFRLAGRGLFGRGAYFAEASLKADQYSGKYTFKYTLVHVHVLTSTFYTPYTYTCKCIIDFLKNIHIIIEVI